MKRGNIHWCRTTLDMSVYKRILPIGIADFITEMSAGVIVFLFNHAILKYIGDDGIVTYTVITYIYNLVMMTFTGISQGTQPLVSFYHGKRSPRPVHYFYAMPVYQHLQYQLLPLVSACWQHRL